MARKRSSQPDEGQFSLDDFMNQEPADAENVPGMIDLSSNAPSEQHTEAKPLRTFTMPSNKVAVEQPPTPPPSSDIYHDLGKMEHRIHIDLEKL